MSESSPWCDMCGCWHCEHVRRSVAATQERIAAVEAALLAELRGRQVVIDSPSGNTVT